MTGIDQTCEHVAKDTSKVFHSQTIHRMVRNNSLQAGCGGGKTIAYVIQVKTMEQKSGITENKIYPQSNYSDQTETDKDIDFLTMVTLRQIKRLSEAFLENLIDENEDSD